MERKWKWSRSVFPDPLHSVDCSLPGSSVLGILQAWSDLPFPSPQTTDSFLMKRNDLSVFVQYVWFHLHDSLGERMKTSGYQGLRGWGKRLLQREPLGSFGKSILITQEFITWQHTFVKSHQYVHWILLHVRHFPSGASDLKKKKKKTRLPVQEM